MRAKIVGEVSFCHSAIVAQAHFIGHCRGGDVRCPTRRAPFRHRALQVNPLSYAPRDAASSHWQGTLYAV